MTSDPKAFNNPDRLTLTAEDIDGLANAILELGRQVWVLTDRMAVLETVLDRRGIDVSNEIDEFQPDEAMRAKLDARGEAFAKSLLDAISGR